LYISVYSYLFIDIIKPTFPLRIRYTSNNRDNPDYTCEDLWDFHIFSFTMGCSLRTYHIFFGLYNEISYSYGKFDWDILTGIQV